MAMLTCLPVFDLVSTHSVQGMMIYVWVLVKGLSPLWFSSGDRRPLLIGFLPACPTCSLALPCEYPMLLSNQRTWESSNLCPWLPCLCGPHSLDLEGLSWPLYTLALPFVLLCLLLRAPLRGCLLLEPCQVSALSVLPPKHPPVWCRPVPLQRGMQGALPAHSTPSLPNCEYLVVGSKLFTSAFLVFNIVNAQ